jgi:DNA invertase Pin-like site-specific DNA recombinase
MTAASRRAAVYCRVSTLNGQTTSNQELALRDAADRMGCEVVRVYADQGVSGAKGRDKRPQFDALLKAATRHEFDLVMCWSVDRLGRSLRDLVEFLEELRALKVDLFLHQQGLDSTTPSGRAMFHVAGVFAEWERAIIRERIMAGMTRARVKGTRSGKPIGRPKISPEKRRAILAALDAGNGVVKTARLISVGVSTVERVKREALCEVD